MLLLGLDDDGCEDGLLLLGLDDEGCEDGMLLLGLDDDGSDEGGLTVTGVRVGAVVWEKMISSFEDEN